MPLLGSSTGTAQAGTGTAHLGTGAKHLCNMSDKLWWWWLEKQEATALAPSEQNNGPDTTIFRARVSVLRDTTLEPVCLFLPTTTPLTMAPNLALSQHVLVELQGGEAPTDELTAKLTTRSCQIMVARAERHGAQPPIRGTPRAHLQTDECKQQHHNFLCIVLSDCRTVPYKPRATSYGLQAMGYDYKLRATGEQRVLSEPSEKPVRACYKFTCLVPQAPLPAACATRSLVSS